MKDQLDELQQLLPDYKWTGVGLNDGLNAGHTAPIFNNFKLLKVAFSNCLEAISRLVVTVSGPHCLGLQHGRIYREIPVSKVFDLNTHFDHRGEIAVLRVLA